MRHEDEHRGEHREMLGVRLWSNDLGQLVDRSVHALDDYRAGRGRPFVFACANPHSLAVSERDPEFKNALRTASAVVADGVGLTLVARNLYGHHDVPRITGSDYFAAVMGALDRRAGRAAFFGSRPEVLKRMAARCAVEFPRVTIAASISPPYGHWSAQVDRGFLEQIHAASPDVLWVGMTAPKQEKWVQANLEHISAGIVGSVGAVFDYFAGTIKRAPAWLCRSGLEWAYRFAHEPARLWERNVVSTPQFMGLALRERATMLRAEARQRSST